MALFGKTKEQAKKDAKRKKENVVVDKVESTDNIDVPDRNDVIVTEVKSNVNNWFETEGRELIRCGTGVKSFIIRCANANGVTGNYGEIVSMLGEAVNKQDFEAIAEKLSK